MANSREMNERGEKVLDLFLSAKPPAWLMELRQIESEQNARVTSVDELMTRIGSRVIGQQEELRALLEYACLFERRRMAIRNGAEEDTVIPNRPIMLMGPTASGKTHLVRQAAKALGMKLFMLDTTQFTGAGWRGQSYGDYFYDVYCWQRDNPGCAAIVFFDEFDKSRSNGISGDSSFCGQQDLLKLFDGGMVTFECEGTLGRTSYQLDTDSLFFLIGGAFTSIEEIVARRVKTGLGFNSSVISKESAEELRGQATSQDLADWGIMTEILGRIACIISLHPLCADELAQLVNKSELCMVGKINAVMPEGVELQVDDAAASLLANEAAQSGLGARSIQNKLTSIAAHVASVALSKGASVVRATASGGQLSFEYV